MVLHGNFLQFSYLIFSDNIDQKKPPPPVVLLLKVYCDPLQVSDKRKLYPKSTVQYFIRLSIKFRFFFHKNLHRLFVVLFIVSWSSIGFYTTFICSRVYSYLFKTLSFCPPFSSLFIRKVFLKFIMYVYMRSEVLHLELEGGEFTSDLNHWT